MNPLSNNEYQMILDQAGKEAVNRIKEMVYTIDDMQDDLTEVKEELDNVVIPSDITELTNTVSELKEDIAEITTAEKENAWVGAEKTLLEISGDGTVFVRYPDDTTAKVWHNVAANHSAAIGFQVDKGQEYVIAFKTSAELRWLIYSPYTYTDGTNDIVEFEQDDNGYWIAEFTAKTTMAYIFFTVWNNVGRGEENAVSIYDIRVFKGDNYQQSYKLNNDKISGLTHANVSLDFFDGFATEEELSSLVEYAKVNRWNSETNAIIEESGAGTLFHSYPTENSMKLWHLVSANHYGAIQIALNANTEYTMAFKITNSEFGQDSLVFSPRNYTGGLTLIPFELSDDGYWHATFTTETENAYIFFAVWNNKARSEDDAVTLEDIRIFNGNSYEQSYRVRVDMLQNIGADNLSDELCAIVPVPRQPCEYQGFEEFAMFSKGLCIGDSLTAGVFNYRENGAENYVTIAEYSYPSILHKLTGVELVNMGVGGNTSAQWYAGHSEQDLSGYDFAIIQLGVNDAVQLGGWGDTSRTAFANIVTKLKAENKGIKIFVSTVIRASAYYGANFDNVSAGIRDFVNDLADENVILLDMAQYSHTMDFAAYNQGHLTAYGYYRLAMDYRSYISWYIATHKERFKYVQFIGTDYVY